MVASSSSLGLLFQEQRAQKAEAPMEWVARAVPGAAESLQDLVMRWFDPVNTTAVAVAAELPALTYQNPKCSVAVRSEQCFWEVPPLMQRTTLQSWHLDQAN